MTFENVPAAPITTRQDAFEDVQVSPSSSVPFHPTMFPIPGLSRPPLASLPNATPPSFFSDDYGTGGPSFLPIYRGQGVIVPTETVTPSMFPIDNACFQESFHPFPGMLPGNPTTDLFPSEVSDHHEQPAPLPFQWPLSMQPAAAATWQQAQYQVSQDFLPSQDGGFHDQSFQWPTQAESAATVGHAQDQVAQDHLVMQPSQEPGSVYAGDCQANATFYAAPSAPEVCHQGHQWENQPSFHLPAEDTMSTNGPEAQDWVNEFGQKVYLCEPCNKWVLVHRKKHHDKKHSPELGEFVCKMCELLGHPCKPLSRKDALKRHVDVKHPEYAELLKDLDLEILVPRRKDAQEDLGPLAQAMRSLANA